MVKYFCSIFMMIGLMILCTSPSYFAEMPLRVVVNGEKLDFPDAEPFLDSNSRVQVPVRFIAEALNATVGWSPAPKEVTIRRNKSVLVLTINSDQMKINGEVKTLDTAAVIKDDRTYVPVRFVSEAFGATVEWKANIRTAYITLDKNIEVNLSSTKINEFQIKIEPEDTLTKNNTGGQRVQKASKLYIDEHIKLNDTDPELVLLLNRGYAGADYDKQMQEAKEILLGKLSESCVAEIMEYISDASDIYTILEKQTFPDKRYEILVMAGNRSSVEILVYKP